MSNPIIHALLIVLVMLAVFGFIGIVAEAMIPTPEFQALEEAMR